MRLTLLAIFLLTSVYVQAESVTQTVRGTVKDSETRVTLPGANVILTHTDPQNGTTTDENGNFRFEDVEVGRIS
ncbi:MAG: carboxypeptidase-like regulatory domain-containing protein, partial [Perlabentimonas sp.]